MKYWPAKQGIDLNSKVAYLFNTIHLKLNYCLYNRTENILSFDVINLQARKELFKIIILELEILILDIINLNLTIQDIRILNFKILIDLLNKSINSFHEYILYKQSNRDILKLNYYLSSDDLILEQHLLLEELLIYLIFGNTIAYDNTSYTKDTILNKHVEILLENLVVQLANIVFNQFIQKHKSLSSLFIFLKINKLYNNQDISIKSVTGFKNNLIWQQIVDYYYIQPKAIYNNYYMVWFLTNQGLSYKYIYIYRDNNIKNLSRSQIVIITLLELQNFIIPKLYTILLWILQTLIYICTYLIEKTLILLFSGLSYFIQIK